MKEKAYAAGDSLEMMCSACDTEQNHNVVTATKQGKITKAACEVCNTESTFVRGEKTSVNAMISHDEGKSWSTPVSIATTTDTSDHPLLVSDGQATFLSWMTKADGYRLLPIGDGS